MPSVPPHMYSFTHTHTHTSPQDCNTFLGCDSNISPCEYLHYCSDRGHVHHLWPYSWFPLHWLSINDRMVFVLLISVYIHHRLQLFFFSGQHVRWKVHVVVVVVVFVISQIVDFIDVKVCCCRRCRWRGNH